MVILNILVSVLVVLVVLLIPMVIFNKFVEYSKYEDVFIWSTIVLLIGVFILSMYSIGKYEVGYNKVQIKKLELTYDTLTKAFEDKDLTGFERTNYLEQVSCYNNAVLETQYSNSQWWNYPLTSKLSKDLKLIKLESDGE